MDNKDIYIDTNKFDDIIKIKERGEILYYSVDQIADLLNENINNIKYYTNIFHEFLKIEIVNKELRYTHNDIDKLEFLIKLKTKGMSIKEIRDYYNKLPLNYTEVNNTKNNLLSADDFLDLIKEEQQNQLNNFKIELIDTMKEANSLYIKNITSIIIDEQNKNLNEFKESFSKEIKEYINSGFDNFKDDNIELHNKLLADTNRLISEKTYSNNEDLIINLQNDFNTFIQSSLNNDERLIKEAKDFKGVIIDAYYTQSQIELDNTNLGFLNKLFQINKAK